MANFSVKVDISGFVTGRRSFEEKQLPFIVAKTLTDTAKDAQAAVQGNVRRAFKLRNNWTTQGIRIKPANKNGRNGNIEADVHTDTANRKTGAPDYLGRQEDGGTKVPYGNHEYLAVPTKYLHQMAPGVIPAELRPRALLGAVGGRFTATNRKGQIALRNQKVVRGFVFFIQKMHGGDLAIMGRPFHERYAYPYYLLIHSAHVRRSQMDLGKTVEKIAEERFARHWDRNWQAVYANGLRI
jgi:hypothetical protein